MSLTGSRDLEHRARNGLVRLEGLRGVGGLLAARRLGLLLPQEAPLIFDHSPCSRCRCRCSHCADLATVQGGGLASLPFPRLLVDVELCFSLLCLPPHLAKRQRVHGAGRHVASMNSTRFQVCRV